MVTKTLDDFKVGSKYKREEIFDSAQNTGYKSWKEAKTFVPEFEFGMTPDFNRLSIALTPRDGHFIQVTTYRGEKHLFESVVNKEQSRDLYQKVR